MPLAALNLKMSLPKSGIVSIERLLEVSQSIARGHPPRPQPRAVLLEITLLT